MSHGNWKDMFKAVQENDVELIEFYIRQGIDLNYQHPEYMTSPLIESVRYNHLGITKLLLTNGALPEIKEVYSNKSAVEIANDLGNNEAITIINQYLSPSKRLNIKTQKNGMKAVICTKYGSPEVLQIREIPKPIPKDNEILVRIYASAVNSGDVRVRSLDVNGLMKVVMRMVLGFSKPRKPILGTVFSGVVDTVGNKVSKFKVGDKVFGMTGFNFGTYAEYIAINQKSNVIEMPKNATFEEAVAIIFGGQTAIYFLEKAKIAAKPNSKILIIGATGSVGTAAIQIAKHHKADITAVCSSEGLRLVNELGVKNAILYDKEDFTKQTEKFDIIFDAVGKSNNKQCRNLLNKNGIYNSVSSGYASETIQQLQLLKELFEKRELRAVIDKTFPMREIIDAHKYVDRGRKKGNVVLKIDV